MIVPRLPLRLSILVLLIVLAPCTLPLRAQQEPGAFGGVQSFGFSTSFSNTSSHIFIGESEQRRIWTLGAEYTRLLHRGSQFRLDYEGSILPLYEETDPTVTGTVVTFNGQLVTVSQPPVRVVHVPHGPVGYVLDTTLVPVYATTARQDTYAAAFTPLGARISALPHSRIQPSFALNLGFVVSARDIPIDDSDQFNYLFAFGPGVQLFTDARTSWRLEYLYRHTSNAGQGEQNPGVDQAVLRLTLSLHR